MFSFDKLFFSPYNKHVIGATMWRIGNWVRSPNEPVTVMGNLCEYVTLRGKATKDNEPKSGDLPTYTKKNNGKVRIQFYWCGLFCLPKIILRSVIMKTHKLVLVALFIALSFIGANIKIMSSIAFDSMPAFLATLTMGGPWGALVGVLGHIFTAATSGFPFSLPVHIVVAIFMGISMLGLNYTRTLCAKKMNPFVAEVIGLVVSLIIAPVIQLLCLIPMLTAPVCFSLFPVLLPASIANAVVALIIYRVLPKKYRTL